MPKLPSIIQELFKWLLARYSSLQVVEKRLLVLVLTFALMMGLWLNAWRPVQENLRRAKEQYRQQQVLKSGVMYYHNQLLSQQQTALDKPLSAIVNESAKADGILIESLSTTAQNHVEVKADKVNFTAAIHWLNALETTYNLKISVLEVTKTAVPGQVGINVALEIPGGLDQ